ncbi:MAG: sulfite exporter TauE/SafE family protein [Porticoccaceae bacterium]
MQAYLLYLIIGAVAGLLGGLFGIGGGAVIVPVLIYSFAAHGFSPEVLTHMAIGTSLATILVTSISAITTHHSSRAVLWFVVLWMVPGLCVGAFGGGLFAASLSGSELQFCFGGFLLFVAVRMGLAEASGGRRSLQGPIGKLTAGTGIGFLSGIFGIGGGSLTVPYLSWCGVNIRHAVATSSALGFPIAVSGTLAYVYGGWDESVLPEGAWGYVYVPAFLGIVLTSTPFAGLGAMLAHRLPGAVLQKLFAVVMLGLGSVFILNNVGQLMR